MSQLNPVLELVRYANRKLYARSTSSYVKYEDIYHTILAGRDVHVRCARTRGDVTDYVLGEVFTRFCVRRTYVGQQRMHALIREKGPDLDMKLAVL